MKKKKVEKTIIKVQNVSKSFQIPKEQKDSLKSYFLNPFRKTGYRNFEALKDINFEVKEGEFVGIIGRNGSGKSTLLKLIAGIYLPNEGKIEVKGKLVPFLELGVGFNPELSGRENTFLNGTILGMSRKYLEKKFDEIVDFAEVREFIDLPLKNYSSGMQVRLAFSIAIQADADIYLLDEILAVGDQGFQQKSLKVFERFKREKKTVVYVSHDLSSIRRYCDKVLYIKNHANEKYGSPGDVVDLYVYAEHSEKTRSSTEEVVQDSLLQRKEIEITSVKLLGKDNKVCNRFLCGDDFNVRVDYILHNKRIRDAVFGIGVYQEDDRLVYGTNTKLKNTQINLRSQGSVTFAIKSIPFLQGHFYVSVAVVNNSGKTYDWHDKKYDFWVTSNISDEGLIYLETSIESK
jgi:lipopolysaccharide transport system ATP-binding protein